MMHGHMNVKQCDVVHYDRIQILFLSIKYTEWSGDILGLCGMKAVVIA